LNKININVETARRAVSLMIDTLLQQGVIEVAKEKDNKPFKRLQINYTF